MIKGINILIAFLLIVTSTAYAASNNEHPYKWNASIKKIHYYGEYSNQGEDKTNVSSQQLEAVFKKFHQNVYTIYTTINEELKDELKPIARKMVNKIPATHMSSFSLDVSGPIILTLSAFNGTITMVQVSGFDIHSTIKLKTSEIIHSRIHFKNDNATFSGKYDLQSGKAYDFKMDSKFDVEYKTSVLGHISPLLESFVDSSLEKSINGKIVDYLSDISLDGLWSIDQVLPNNLPNNIDMKWQLDQMLSTLLSGQSIRLQVEDEPVQVTANPYSCYEPGDKTYTDSIAELTLSGKLTFAISRDRTQHCTWDYNSGRNPDY